MDSSKAIVIYDGDCAFCNWSVKWVRTKDKQGRFAYLPITKAVDEGLLPSRAISRLTGDEVGLWHDQRLFLGHAAVTQIMKLLGGFYFFMGSVWSLVPAPVKRWAYRQVADRRNRFRSLTRYC
ncbi:MAG: DUF393 domain-containing protein [Breznakibacter sp.]